MTAHRQFHLHTAHGGTAVRVNSRPGTSSTLQKLLERSKTSQKAAAGCPTGTVCSPRNSRFPKMADRTSRRSYTRHSIRRESRLKAVVKAPEKAPGWAFER